MPCIILFFTNSGRSSRKFSYAISDFLHVSTQIMWFSTTGVGSYRTEVSSHVDISDVDTHTCITVDCWIELQCKMDNKVCSLQNLSVMLVISIVCTHKTCWEWLNGFSWNLVWILCPCKLLKTHTFLICCYH